MKSTGECPRLVSKGIGITEVGITHHKDWDRASYDREVCDACIDCPYDVCWLDMTTGQKIKFRRDYKIVDK